MPTKLPYAILLFALGLAGCGSDSPVSPVPLYPYDGNWLGRTSEGRDVVIGIQNSVVVRFEADFKLGLYCASTLGASQAVSAAIQNQAFSFHLSQSATGGPLVVPIQGRFGSTGTLSGTIGAMELGSSWCNDDKPYTVPALTFTAEQ